MSAKPEISLPPAHLLKLMEFETAVMAELDPAEVGKALAAALKASKVVGVEGGEDGVTFVEVPDHKVRVAAASVIKGYRELQLKYTAVPAEKMPAVPELPAGGESPEDRQARIFHSPAAVAKMAAMLLKQLDSTPEGRAEFALAMAAEAQESPKALNMID